MNIARHHAEWLSLVETSGPFLSVPVLLRVFPRNVRNLASPSDGRARDVLKASFGSGLARFGERGCPYECPPIPAHLLCRLNQPQPAERHRVSSRRGPSPQRTTRQETHVQR